MSTIPRKFLTTSKDGLSSITPLNGQIILIYDSDEVYYDLPANGQRDGAPVRRKVSGVRVVDTLPENPMEGIAYVYVGNHGTLPESNDPIYDIRVWDDGKWKVVGNNWEDAFVESRVDDSGTFYLVGAPELGTTKGSLKKATSVYVQQNELYGNLNGNATSATSAKNANYAAVANKATNDNATEPKPITDYLYSVRVNTQATGSTITFTKGDTTTEVPIWVPDTTYSKYTANTDGLVPKTSTTVGSDTTGLLLSGSGWINASQVSGLNADKANKDGSGNIITSTYVTNANYDISSHSLTLTYGNGTVGSPISIPDTTYNVFDSTSNGLVPAASGTGDDTRFLQGSGDWVDIIQDEYNGTDRTPGLVPASTASADGLQYLSDAGTWIGSFTEGVNGLVPAPTSSDDGKYLVYDGVNRKGVWTTAPDTLNTAGSTNDITNKLFVIGGGIQSSSTQTFSNQYVYIQGSRLYQYDSDHTQVSQVVDLTSSQNLTNKTYEGMQLGSAASKTATSSVVSGTNVPTNDAVISYVQTAVPTLISSLSLINEATLADAYDPDVSYSVNDWCIYNDNDIPYLYRCTNATTGDFDSDDWQYYTVIDAIKYLIAHPS